MEVNINQKDYVRNALKVIEEYVCFLEGFEKIISDYVVANDAMKHMLETEVYVETSM
ncbi:hypothetical protein ACTQ5R_09400 [Ruoffia tabacinasalis]|uniref:hypothetical protein n=1 Tax=Ruoffia tabacinasalis TaxID=87458 RepID=UPI003F9E21F9